MVNSIRSAAIAALLLTVGGGSALAEGDLFVRQQMLTPEQIANYAPRPADPMALEQRLAAAVMRESNARRAQAGLGPLDSDPELSVAARRYSQKMRDMAFFAHDAPDGEGLDLRLPEEARYRYSRLGENLWSGKGALDWRAATLSAQATDDWILSPSHRDNLLEPVYDVAGVGVAVASDQVFVTMLYAKPRIDAASARLSYIYRNPPADLFTLTRGLEGAALRSLNGARGEMGLPAIANDAALSREARLHAEASLAGGGFSAASREGEIVLRRVLDDRSNRTNSLSMLMWEARGGVTWQDEVLARTALASWRKNPSNMADILSQDHDRAGIGVASDGTRVFMSVLLSETNDPTVQVISSGLPLSTLNGGALDTLSGGTYISID